MWDDFESELSKEFNVFCLDLPGFGDSHFDVTGLSIEELAMVVQNEINSLQLDNYVIVGHSLGGYIALEIAKQFPNKLKGLGLFHSTVLADTTERKEKRNDVIRFMEKHGAKVFGKSFIPQLFYQPKRDECKPDIQKLSKIAANTSDITLIEVTKAMQNRNDNLKLLENIEIPVLFIVGKNDTTITIEDVYKQIHLPKNSIIQLLDNCGHVGMFEQRNQTLKQVSNFINYCY